MMEAVVAGATGLVGSALLDDLASQQFPVTAIARRTGAPRIGVLWRCTDLAQLKPAAIPKGTTVAFCALGTTIGVAGSKEAFRAVDHGLVLAFAKACRNAGVPTFCVVSAAGADATSRIFYNRVKGEMERDLAALGFPSLCVLRPSLLMGDRQERRPLERAAIVVTRALRPVLPRRWRGIEATAVARALLVAAADAQPGVRIVDNAEIRVLGA